LVLRHDEMEGRAIGLNVRTLKDIDLEDLELEKINGADREPAYLPPEGVDIPEDKDSDLRGYTGNCHCGAVRYHLKSKPLSDIKVMSCNCSLCSRNGDLWIYPKKSEVDIHGGKWLTDYVFLHEDSLHSFCSFCGVSVVVRVTDPAEDIMPVNVRTINGLDFDALKFNKYDGKNNDPQYQV